MTTTAIHTEFRTGEEIIWNGDPLRPGVRAVIDEIKGGDYYLTVIAPDGSEGFQLVEAHETHLMEKADMDATTRTDREAHTDVMQAAALTAMMNADAPVRVTSADLGRTINAARLHPTAATSILLAADDFYITVSTRIGAAPDAYFADQAAFTPDERDALVAHLDGLIAQAQNA